jgi:hypothetical protein
MRTGTGAVSAARFLALIALAAPCSGCAALINGVSDKLTAHSDTPGARVYVDGFDATGAPIVVPNDRSHIILVRAAGYRDKVVVVNPTVQSVPIVLDVVLAVPSFLIAPLVDISLNWWTAIYKPKQAINLEPPNRVARERPVYAGVQPTAPTIAPPAQPTPPPAQPAATNDTIYTKDGRTLVGKILSEDAKNVTIMLTDGHGTAVPTANISRIARGSAPK